MRPAGIDPQSLPPEQLMARIEYAAVAGGFDEMVDAAGVTRPHWQPFRQALEAIGLVGVARSWEDARHLLREYGVTYNVHGDPRGLERPWELDPIPLLIPAAETRLLEAAMAQRARLLEMVLADLYGPQRLLRERLLPLEIVFANPAFLRPLHGVRPAGGKYLSLYAANLARSATGAFIALGDRTQAPSGAGYALKNRIVLSRMLPDVFSELRVERLARFFLELRESLRALAPVNKQEPRVVLLTPGPYNETYFEHAFLARYLGFTLAEGADLTVRDSKVYLKLLDGLQPVDVILRRLDEDFCDPLELRPDSFLGVPGLVHAVREGNVAVANALGSGLVESPAMAPYLEGICRLFLSEDLQLPSAPTWWCGDSWSLEGVLLKLDQMVVKPAFVSTRMEPVFGDALSRSELDALRNRIRARPHEFAVQERVPLSTAPVLVEGKLEPRPVVVRSYAAARGDTYTLLPGALTRFSSRASSKTVSMQSGGGSKDTWMLSTTPVSKFSLLSQRPQPIELSRAGGDLPSRVADNLFWLGRYAERADGLTRLWRGILVRCTERSGIAETPELPALVRALPPAAKVGSDAAGIDLKLLSEDVLALILDPQRQGSLAALLGVIQRSAGTVRDYIAVDMWRVLAALGTGRTCDSLSSALEFLDRTVEALAAYSGLAAESMMRGAGWRFLDMGRRLERSLSTLTLIEQTLGSVRGSEGPILDAVLEIADSSMIYRRRYLGDLHAAGVLDLLLTDRTNPRSLIFQLMALADDVRQLPSRNDLFEETLALDALATLGLAAMEDLAKADDCGQRPELVSFLRKLAASLPKFSDLITARYLTHLQTSRHLGGSRGGGGT